jgi:hypothetical protein
VVLTRRSRLMRASSVGESTIGDTLLSVSECLAVLNEGPAEHFLFPHRTEPPTHWQASYMPGSKPALRSSVIAGVHTGISTVRVTRTALSTTASTGSIRKPGTTQIPSSPRGVASRSSSGSTTGENYHYYLALYMFAARCKAQGFPPFLPFLHLVANIDWSQCYVPGCSARATCCSCRGPRPT